MGFKDNKGIWEALEGEKGAGKWCNFKKKIKEIISKNPKE